VIGETLTLMIKQISATIAKGIAPVRVRLETAKTYNDTQLDVLAAARLALSMLNGPATHERRILLRLAMHVIFQINILKESDIEELRVQLRRLDLICDLQDSIKEACDCSFLFWSKEMIPPYFSYIYQHPAQAQRLHYILAATRDIIPLFTRAVHVDPKVLIDGYKVELEDALKNQILVPLCRDIETDLRLHIHSHLEVSVRDPLKTGIKDLARFVNIKPLRFFDKYIDTKAHVSHYLDTTFYNLNTVALYDWKTYGEMRNLAEYKYGLSLTEVHLPGQTLEQGLDVLEIMRNIHIFVAKYNYNINNQIFIERQSDSKTLNTINIGHISNSIRTHGTGIMNTTVNFTFQFLRQKFNIFSQFLYDDHIKSRLYKDIKHFKENRDQLGNMYPFDRSKKFNKDIRKLGVNDANLSFFDRSEFSSHKLEMQWDTSD
jgi:WASH complex subunit 7